MPNTIFLLKEPKTTTETLVYLFFVYQTHKLKYSTGQKIKPKFWNAKTQRARENREFPQYPEFNAYLDNLETEIQKCFRLSVINGQLPTVQQLRDFLDKNVTFRNVVPEPIQPEKVTFFRFIEQFIEEKKKTVKDNTWKKFVSTYNHLKRFAAIKGVKAYDFNDITIEWFFDFVDYLYSPPNEFGVNHASKTIDIIRQLLNEATDREHNQNRAYQSKKFRIPKEPVYDIYLSEAELKKLFDLNLTNKAEGFRTVRDLFLIGCYTGLRYSDWEKIRPDLIEEKDGAKLIRVTPDKTNKTISIPLHPTVLAIIEKYNGQLPANLENQPCNRYLKELGELAAIDTLTVLPSSKGGKTIELEGKKFEFMQTHTARRSFATNAYLNGVDSLLIMAITGHKTEREFLKYIKVSEDEKAVLMSKSAFFQKPKTE